MNNEDLGNGGRYTPSPEQAAYNREQYRRQEWRTEYLVPIYVSWTSDVPTSEGNAAVQGVRDALIASGQNRQLEVFGDSKFGQPSQEYSSPDWYVQQARRSQSLRRDIGHGEQIDLSEIMNLFIREPFQEKPHWEVFILNKDLNTPNINGEYLNYVFGATRPEFASVQSIRRLIDQVQPGPLRLAMVRRLLRHEVGHMFLLPSRSQNVTDSLGRHCTNVCTMRQGLSIQEWANNTVEEVKKGIHFCKDCQSDLTRLRSKYKPTPDTPR